MYRITGNVFADIPGDVNPHAVHIEGSEELNQIDNNIFSHLTGGILIRDTNNVIIAYNLFLDCNEVCVDTVSGINGPRPIGGHTNDVHNLMVHGNVFFGLGRSAIEFTNGNNDADGNVYPNPAGPRRVRATISAREDAGTAGVGRPEIVARTARLGYERRPCRYHGHARPGHA